MIYWKFGKEGPGGEQGDAVAFLVELVTVETNYIIRLCGTWDDAVAAAKGIDFDRYPDPIAVHVTGFSDDGWPVSDAEAVDPNRLDPAL